MGHLLSRGYVDDGHESLGNATALHHRHNEPVMFGSTEGMHVVGKGAGNGDGLNEDDDPVVWVYQINVLKWWAEIVAITFMVMTLLMMANQIGLHLHYSEHPGFRTYTVIFNASASLHTPSCRVH
jgi:hypothetical protein